MRKLHWTWTSLAAGICLLVPVSASASPMYSITDLGAVLVTGLNDSGQVVGYDWSRQESFVYQNGTFSYAQASLGWLGGINNDGKVAIGASIGTIDPQSGQIANIQQISLPASAYNALPVAINNHGDLLISQGFDSYLYQNGKLIDFAKLFPGQGITPISLNDAGQVVLSVAPLTGSGTYPGVTGSTEYLYQNGKVQTLPGSWTIMGSNSSGQLVGSSIPSAYPGPTNDSRALLIQNGTATDLGSLGGSLNVAYAINSKGEVVGSSQVTLSNLTTTHAFLYQQGTMVDLNALIPPLPGVTLFSGRFINDQGQIIAEGGGLNGPVHDYLLTPIPAQVPEPGMITVFGLCIAALVFRCSHRPK